MTTTVIVIVVALLGAGLVASQLLRLRDYLKRPLPPQDPPPDLPDDNSAI